MNFESPNLSNEISKESEEIELNISPEDLENLIILKNKIQDIQNSGYKKSQKFEVAKLKFLGKIQESFEEGEINRVAAIALLKGQGLSLEVEAFDFGGQYSVLDFVNSFE